MTRCNKIKHIPVDSLNISSKLMYVLEDEINRKILFLLESNGAGMRISEITKNTYLFRPSVIHHLQSLHHTGLVIGH